MDIMTTTKITSAAFALLLTITLAVPLASNLSTGTVGPNPKVEHLDGTTFVPKTTSLYEMYATRYPNYRRTQLAHVMSGVMTVGGLTGLLCGIQLAVGATAAV